MGIGGREFMTEEQYDKLIDDIMNVTFCSGIFCGNCSMHTESQQFRSKYDCSCLLVAMAEAIVASGVDYNVK